MSPEQFAMWLRGFLTATTGSTLTSEQSEAIRKELAKVKVSDVDQHPVWDRLLKQTPDELIPFELDRSWPTPYRPFQPYWPDSLKITYHYQSDFGALAGATFVPEVKV